ncbi:MAG TPA: 4Fe-4S binding protein [Armatimonadota bacterium]|jgi:ferredoxin
MRRLTALLILIATWTEAVWAERRFPLPQFTDHALPQTAYPLPGSGWLLSLDYLALLLALVLATYLSLVRRSRVGLFALTLVSLAYFGFYRHGCICAVGAIQNVAQSLGDHGYALPLSAAIFFLLPLIFALFVGRVFCAAVCPLGAAQEVVLVKPVKIPVWLEHALGLIPFIYLGVAVLYAATGASYLICQYDPFVAFFRMSGSTTMLLAGGLLLVIAMFVGRVYCRVLCPYSALLRLVAPFAYWRVSVTPRECVQCRLCEDACPFGAINPPTPSSLRTPRLDGKRRLALLLLLLPLLVAGGAWLGYRGSAQLAAWHPTVRLATRVLLEDEGRVTGTTTESVAFRAQGVPTVALYQQALTLREQFRWGGLLLGAWIGLVLGGKLIALSIRRRQDSYEADPGRCLACGRCYRYCPVGRHAPARDDSSRLTVTEHI